MWRFDLEFLETKSFIRELNTSIFVTTRELKLLEYGIFS